MLWTNDFEPLAIHFSLRIIIVTKHGLSVNVSLVERAEKRLALNLEKK